MPLSPHNTRDLVNNEPSPVGNAVGTKSSNGQPEQSYISPKRVNNTDAEVEKETPSFAKNQQPFESEEQGSGIKNASLIQLSSVKEAASMGQHKLSPKVRELLTQGDEDLPRTDRKHAQTEVKR